MGDYYYSWVKSENTHLWGRITVMLVSQFNRTLTDQNICYYLYVVNL